ncbi:hypothetical protein TNCV_1836011 [Trichonephila clavipes]|nr:hypothetical protein TNCV_1836011 [Trichonephila clavipes]
MLVGTSKDYSMARRNMPEKSISLGKNITIAEGRDVHIKSNPGRKVVDVITRPARPKQQREDATNKRRNQSSRIKPHYKRPFPYYLRSRVKESDGIPEEQRNIEINGILTAE